tara:strand:- start:191 stop:730 length:540 start_codon:yes stop_codon:yes gene_type:complete
MRYPPIKLDPESLVVYNGAPSRSGHAVEVDKYQTWLACIKPQQPVMIGGYYKTGIDYTIELLLPQYTANVRFGFLVDGAGIIDIECDDDTYTARITVESGTGASGSHSFATAKPLWFEGPLGSAGADDLNRSLDTSFTSSPRYSTFTWSITDKSGAQSLRVYLVDVKTEWPDESAQLPA